MLNEVYVRELPRRACTPLPHRGMHVSLQGRQALKEVYLPESGVWLADYPYVNRAAFLATSLDLERERNAAEPSAFAR